MTVAWVVSAILLAAAPDPHAEGKRLFERASIEYSATRYSDALADFASAYATDPVAGFLFNIGQCHRELGNWAQAGDFYRRYLAAKPDAKNADTVRQLLAMVESKARQEAELRAAAAIPPVVVREPAPAPAAAVTAPEKPTKRRGAGPWVLAGSGAAVGITGAVLGVIALDNGDRATPGDGVTVHSLTQAQANTANSLATAGLVLGTVGLAAVAGGIAWWLAR